MSVTEKHSFVSVAVLLAVHPLSVVASVQMSTHDEVILSPEVQCNIPQLCGRSSHNHRQSGKNVFCLQSCWS